MRSKPTSAPITTLYGRRQDRYLELVSRFPLRPIRSDAELSDAIDVIDSLIDQDKLSAPEQDYLDVLSDLVEAYEEDAIPIKPVDDAGLLRILVAGRRVSQAQVAKATSIAESTISEVLAGKRKLNRGQIGKLARYFHVAPGAFAFTE